MIDQPLHRLVYYSRNLIAGDNGTFQSEVAKILAKSRRNNENAAITGALIFNAGCFAQVLEGPIAAVEDIFERIQQDERHGDVSLLGVDRIEKRSFPNWAMGFLGESPTHSELFKNVGASSGFNIEQMTGDEIHVVLTRLAIEQEAG